MPPRVTKALQGGMARRSGNWVVAPRVLMEQEEAALAEDFRQIQPYFKEKSVENIRFASRIRTKLVSNIPGNFKNMYKNNKAGLKCSHCLEEVMTQIHCISCPGMSQMRDGLELSKIEDMVIYFKRILKARDKK